jgi:hypothetical protein
MEYENYSGYSLLIHFFCFWVNFSHLNIYQKATLRKIPLTTTHQLYTILINVLWLTPVDWITKHTTQESFGKNLHYYVLVNSIVWEGGKGVKKNVCERWKSKHKKKRRIETREQTNKKRVRDKE